MTAIEAIAAAAAATTPQELYALLNGETRVTVVTAIKTRLEELTAPVGAQPPAEAAAEEAAAEEDDEDDGLVEVTTLGEAGTHKNLFVNGVASAVACGIVTRVTPEVAEQWRQCNII